ncbi:universal stress protein [Albibacterium indicum]|uniref:universal stress protein n=1 Tax=Albibacterium indicum TaxID=2292082 RepID=UPI000E4BD59F|nr:universal stress protein [Pedobacter indicus]
MDTLIIATNFSDSCTNAAKYGAALSEQLAVKEIVLLNSYELPITSEVSIADSSHITMLRDRSLEKLGDLQKQLMPLLAEDININIIASDISILKSLELLRKKSPNSIVIMGASRKGRIEKLIMGSTTSSLVRNAPLPLLIIPQDSHFVLIKKAVYAVNFKKLTKNTPIQTITTIVRQLNAQVLVLNVGHNEGDNLKPDLTEDIYELDNFMESEKPQYYYTENKNIADGILSFSDEQEADLLITVPKDYALFESIFHKSTSKVLANKTHLPLLILKEKKDE